MATARPGRCGVDLSMVCHDMIESYHATDICMARALMLLDS